MVAQENCARAFSASETGGARGLDDTSSEPTWREIFAFVAEHPDGADLAAIGKVFGITKERVRQIEERARAKVRLVLRRLAAIERRQLKETMSMIITGGSVIDELTDENSEITEPLRFDDGRFDDQPMTPASDGEQGAE